MTHIQVARILGVAHQTIESWEHNRRRIAPQSERKIVAFLGYDPGLSSGTPAVVGR
jgi:DNA-binding transcriptional regulator YiaG